MAKIKVDTRAMAEKSKSFAKIATRILDLKNVMSEEIKKLEAAWKGSKYAENMVDSLNSIKVAFHERYKIIMQFSRFLSKTAVLREKSEKERKEAANLLAGK